MDTNWIPALSEDGPRYRALADAIACAIEHGSLAPGDRLPPVRELAWRLKVTPGTVARAYHLAENRGLLDGQVGRGTFVRPRDAETLDATDPSADEIKASSGDGQTIDLRMNHAIDVGQDQILTAALGRLIARHGALPLTDYHRYRQSVPERAAAASWLAAGGLPNRPEDTLITSGAQHALLTAMAATLGGGDTVALTEPLIHPGMKDCARALGLRLEPVPADLELGLDPEALDAAAARIRPGAIILTANRQNPTLASMPTERRVAIAEIAARRRIPVIEDDVYGWTNPPEDRLDSFPNLIPDLCWYVTSFSKCVAAGVRAGFLLCPIGEGQRGARLIQGFTLQVSWLVSALAAELIASGDAARIAAAVGAETRERSDDLRRSLSTAATEAGCRLRVVEDSSMAWLDLPECWRASDFHTMALGAGVLVSPAEIFAVGRAAAPQAVRIAFGAATRSQLAAASARLSQLLCCPPGPVDAVA